MLNVQEEVKAAATPSIVMLAALPAVLFVLSAWRFLTLPPTMDTYKVLWMVSELPWWSYLTDPLSAGYAFLFHFEPLWPLLHAVDLALKPILGGAAHHFSNVAGMLLLAGVLMRMIADAEAKPGVLVLSVALLLFSAPAWFDVAFAPMNHFPLAAAFGLLSVRPAWRVYLGKGRADAAASLTSAAFYGLSLAAKESIAGAPLLIAALLVAARRESGRAVAFVVPHAVVLGLLLLWRLHILGGLGGYPMEEQLLWRNLVVALPTLAALLWGSAWMAVPVAAFFCWSAPRLIPLAALGYLAGISAFLFAGAIDDESFYPLSAARLLFVWAWLLLLAALAVSRLDRPRQRLAAAVVAVLLLGLQWMQRDVIDRGIVRLLPHENLSVDPSAPTALLSGVSLGYFAQHLMRPEPKAPLIAYQTVPSIQLDLALGHQWPADMRKLRFPNQLKVPQLTQLPMDGVHMWADERGRFHLRFPEHLRGKLYLSWIQENDGARWFVTLLPLQRTTVDFPLNYSIRTVILSTLSDDDEPWPTYVWSSPFFRDPYPPRAP